MNYTDNDSVWQELANSIIISAGREYIDLHVEERRHKVKNLGKIMQLKRFFYSDRFKLYTKIDPDRFVHDLDAEIERRLYG